MGENAGDAQNEQKWAGGGLWVWIVVGSLVVVLLIVVINKLSQK